MPLTTQCNNATEQNTDEILLQPTSTPSPELLNTLEMWISGPFPHVTVSRLGLQLSLDRSCPLYTTSPTSDECLDPVSAGVTRSSNSGAIAGALIGGILLGAILTVGVGSVIVLLLLWWRQRGGDKKVQMMKKVDLNMGTTLVKRYIPSTENLHQESNDAGYEPIGVYIKDGDGDRRAGNTYELQADEQNVAKQKKQKKKSNKDSGEKVIEDESGYVVPDTLWQGKQRPVAPGSAASAKTPGKSSKNTTPTPETITSVEYDVPEGIDTSKMKGQKETLSAQQVSTSTLGQKEHVKQAPTGKGHQKRKLQAKEPLKITSQPENNELKKSAGVQDGGKPTKKNKPILHQKKENSSKLALQYQSSTSTSSFGKPGAAATSTVAPQQAHGAVKSKLQNLLTPAVSSQPTKATHAKLSKQPSTSATESAKVQQKQQEPQQTSKVMAMAQKLQGVGQTSATAGPEMTDSKSSGAKKKYVLH